MRQNAEHDPRPQGLITAIDSYRDKDARHYIHLVDGGINDNAGMRAACDRVATMRGPANARKKSLR